MLSEDFLMDSN